MSKSGIVSGACPPWSAESHKEGEGITLFLDAIPVGFDGRIVLLPPKADEDAQGGERGEAAGVETQGEGA